MEAKYKELPTTVEPKKAEVKVEPKKKKKKLEPVPVAPGLTEAEKEELAKTEEEVDVEKKEYICVVHKWPITGAVYICHHCRTFYCVRCANALKEKGENCWSCNKEFDL